MPVAIPAAQILEAAGRAWDSTDPVPNAEMQNNLEWAWGLGRDTFDEHLSSYSDPKLVDVLLDDDLILVAHSDLVREIYLAAGDFPLPFLSKKRGPIQNLYKGRETFEYVVLPVDPSSGVSPRTIISCIPPHLTVSCTVDSILKHAGYAWSDFDDIYESLIKLFAQSPAPGATFILDRSIFTNLKFIHRRWGVVSFPRRFLGLEGSQFEASDSSDDTGSSTMDWEAPTPPDEPQCRLFPHELKQDPVLKFWVPAAANEDDAISRVSCMTGIEDPGEFAKASLARGVYSPNHAWLNGVESWVNNASGVGAVGDQVLVNDTQIEDDERPRAVTSLDLEAPDYFRLCKIPKRA